MPASLEESQKRMILTVLSTSTVIILGFVAYAQLWVFPGLERILVATSQNNDNGNSHKNGTASSRNDTNRQGSILYGCWKTFACMAVATILLTWPITLWNNPNAEEDASHMTSSINFCETEFQHSRWMAEPANTVSSATSYIPLALLGMMQQSSPQSRFSICYASIFMIGVGSTLLHAFLTAVTQGGDELPILWYAAAVSFCGFSIIFPKIPGIATIVAFTAMVSTAVYVKFRESFIIFWIMFTIYLVVHVIALVHISFFFNWEKDTEGVAFKRKVLLPLARATALWLIGASWTWVSEMLFCPFSQEAQSEAHPLTWLFFNRCIHAIWHFTSAITALLSVLVLQAADGFLRGRGIPVVVWAGIPKLVFENDGTTKHKTN